MESWNKIIHTAMMGTDKKMPASQDFVSAIAEAATVIDENSTIDKEEKFLQLASLGFNFRQCATMALQKETLGIELAPAEDKPYCSPAAMQVLKEIIGEESDALLALWLTACANTNKLVTPDMLPVLLSSAKQKKQLRTLVTACAGKRGEWLAMFNPDWNFTSATTAEEIWNTGTPEQRKKLLRELRGVDAAAALGMLQQSWPQEDAASKIAFLEILSEHINDDDITFVESLQAEKSKKVKEEAQALLKQVASSSIVKQYMALMQQVLSLKIEKALLGMMSKTSIQFQLPGSIDESIFKTGIEKLSSDSKKFTDDEFIIYQLIQFVPPRFWEQQLEKNPQQVIELLEKDKTGQKMIPALLLATIRFRDKEWVRAFVQHCKTFYLDLLPWLNADQQEYYANRSFFDDADVIIQYAVHFKKEWSKELSLKIFQHTSKNTYQYNRTFYNENIAQIPAAIEPELEQIIPPEEYQRNSWNKTKDQLRILLRLKKQISTSFTAN